MVDLQRGRVQLYFWEQCGRISLWPRFRRLRCYFLLNAAMPHGCIEVILCQREELIYRVARIFFLQHLTLLANHIVCIILLFILCRAVNARWMCLGGRVLVQTAPPAKSALLISRGASFWNVSIKDKQQTSKKIFLMHLLVTALVYALSYLPPVWFACVWTSSGDTKNITGLENGLLICICVTKCALCTAELKQLNWFDSSYGHYQMQIPSPVHSPKVCNVQS